jgi:hypothetical protein
MYEEILVLEVNRRPAWSGFSGEGAIIEKQVADPIIIVFMFLARLAIPVLLMLGLSYLLKRLGLIKEPPPPPNNGNHNGTPNSVEGSVVNEKH